MGLVSCPDCGKSISDAAPTCNQCGRPMTGQGTPPEAREVVPSPPLPLFKRPARKQEEMSGLFAVFIFALFISPLVVMIGGLFMYVTDRVRVSTFLGAVAVTGVVWVFLFVWMQLKTKGQAPSPELQGQLDALKYGPLSAQMACPHCQSRGVVHTKKVTQKKGVSGGKATAAVLTGGLSMLATGLSRKEALTEAHCVNCGATWHF